MVVAGSAGNGSAGAETRVRTIRARAAAGEKGHLASRNGPGWFVTLIISKTCKTKRADAGKAAAARGSPRPQAEAEQQHM